MSKSVFILPTNQRLKVNEEVIELLFSLAQDSLDALESGGILVGRILESSADYVIDDASVPMAKDVQKRNSFVRDSEGHQEYFDQHWAHQEGRCFYLGEWHTHPEKVPKPSFIDQRGWRNLLNAKIQEQTTLFFIIVGIQRLVIWQGVNRNGRIRIFRVGDINRYE
ncbi:Mov34/MPN/PAD-1 family protein [Cohnella phaseoli]|uniref:Integrative and conjugative element protein (TIGR02256 family) n=1 Tax=Cohnella phaseoli TaxID=456490 RepID=A0A3D9KRC2_9BACL|nr:Mov34/MPN/PAD-1 family protein [Cohnella phaseoli]RED89167.1 integrative and conjugative element protein (TIGR02256 family) [Cohnella phaseoli]